MPGARPGRDRATAPGGAGPGDGVTGAWGRSPPERIVAAGGARIQAFEAAFVHVQASGPTTVVTLHRVGKFRSARRAIAYDIYQIEREGDRGVRHTSRLV
jgi:hypothetical protein